jgi:hypothetical protein
MKTIATFVVAIALVAATGFADDAKYVKLVQVSTGKVLAVADNSTENEARAVVAVDDGSKSQAWTLEKDGDFYKIVNRNSGKVLDVENESEEEEGAIIQWEDKSEGNNNQRWSWEGEGEGEGRRLKSKSSNLVLDVDTEGGVVQRKANDKSKSQLWKVVEIKK